MKQTLWCCVNTKYKEPEYSLMSLAITKKGSMDQLRSNWPWKIVKKDGWKCIKVEVIIKPINEV